MLHLLNVHHPPSCPPPPPLPPSSFSSSFNFSLLFAAAAITASSTFTRALLTATPTAARLANVIRSSSSGALLYQIIYILSRPSGNSIEPNLKLAVCFHSRRSGLLSDARSVSAHLFLCISHPVRHCLTNFLTSNVLSPPPFPPSLPPQFIRRLMRPLIADSPQTTSSSPLSSTGSSPSADATLYGTEDDDDVLDVVSKYARLTAHFTVIIQN